MKRVVFLLFALALAACDTPHDGLPRAEGGLVPVTPELWDYTGNDVAVTPTELGR